MLTPAWRQKGQHLFVCRTYTSRATVPYRTVHQLTCRVDGAELRWVCVRVLYCTALHVDTGALNFSRDVFGMRSVFVQNLFGMPASCLPPCIHAGRQAVGTRTSTVLHTTSIRTSVVLYSYQG